MAKQATQAGAAVFPVGQGSLLPISSTDLRRLEAAGVELEQCKRCNGTGIAARYHDAEDGELVEEACSECAGRGCVTWDGHCIPEVLRVGALRCKRCKVSTLSLGDGCDCCAVCGASPDEQCSPHEPPARPAPLPVALARLCACGDVHGGRAYGLCMSPSCCCLRVREPSPAQVAEWRRRDEEAERQEALGLWRPLPCPDEAHNAQEAA